MTTRIFRNYKISIGYSVVSVDFSNILAYGRKGGIHFYA